MTNLMDNNANRQSNANDHKVQLSGDLEQRFNKIDEFMAKSDQLVMKHDLEVLFARYLRKQVVSEENSPNGASSSAQTSQNPPFTQNQTPPGPNLNQNLNSYNTHQCTMNQNQNTFSVPFPNPHSQQKAVIRPNVPYNPN